MNVIRIICLAGLAGIATAGVTWYLWGIMHNIAALRNNDSPEDAIDTEEAEEPVAD